MLSSDLRRSYSLGRVERFETIVIGGGQAGLAVGHELASRDVDFVILSDETRLGDNWRTRWDSLRLFTPAKRSGLPGLPFPAPSGHLPDKDEMADYLERYAERFDLPVRLRTRVESLDSDGERYVVKANGSVFEADSVVVATGAFQRRPGSANCTRASTRIPGSCPTDRRWSSAPATRESRSPSSSRAPGRCGSPAGTPDTCRGAFWVGTSSTGCGR